METKITSSLKSGLQQTVPSFYEMLKATLTHQMPSTSLDLLSQEELNERRRRAQMNQSRMSSSSSQNSMMVTELSNQLQQRYYMILSLRTSNGMKYDYPFPLSYLNLYDELIQTKQALIEEMEELKHQQQSCKQDIINENQQLKIKFNWLRQMYDLDQKKRNTESYLQEIQHEIHINRTQLLQKDQGLKQELNNLTQILQEEQQRNKLEYKKQIKTLEQLHLGIDESVKEQKKIKLKINQTENELQMSISNLATLRKQHGYKESQQRQVQDEFEGGISIRDSTQSLPSRDRQTIDTKKANVKSRNNSFQSPAAKTNQYQSHNSSFSSNRSISKKKPYFELRDQQILETTITSQLAKEKFIKAEHKHVEILNQHTGTGNNSRKNLVLDEDIDFNNQLNQQNTQIEYLRQDKKQLINKVQSERDRPPNNSYNKYQNQINNQTLNLEISQQNLMKQSIESFAQESFISEIPNGDNRFLNNTLNQSQSVHNFSMMQSNKENIPMRITLRQDQNINNISVLTNSTPTNIQQQQSRYQIQKQQLMNSDNMTQQNNQYMESQHTLSKVQSQPMFMQSQQLPNLSQSMNYNINPNQSSMMMNDSHISQSQTPNIYKQLKAQELNASTAGNNANGFNVNDIDQRYNNLLSLLRSAKGAPTQNN
ncbi:UNKNOWN [Stylonychia lemnae]|uniref:Uncharacterized protein n=1 Tax=Stylonychia lemnae TaxID=5949 RepID=A0A078B6Q8_STYLE|nr:UNKNOWN [Stylonychia lemnae]|eukprot:CDW88977.1 UNKNOWN [Stylonychia lemnae]